MRLRYYCAHFTLHRHTCMTPPFRSRIVFCACLACTATPWCGTAEALLLGAATVWMLGNPWPSQSSTWSKRLLQLSVVGLGFGVPASEIWHTAREAVTYTPIGIAVTLLLGWVIGRWCRTSNNVSTLISFGTAICGGSAIATMAPVIQAEDDEIAVSLATVFSLNALALLLFPPLGHALGLSERQFGLLAALAIHDTSSVVGATSAFGATALAVGTTVKLARAVWITPFTLAASWARKGHGKITVPLFIGGFIAATLVRSAFPSMLPAWNTAAAVARQGLVVTLFLIGNGLTREVLGRVGMRPLLQGVSLWLVVSALTVLAILAHVIT